MDNNKQFQAKELIIEKSLSLGFSHIGFSQATFLEKEARYLEKWLSEGKHGSMAYLENNFDKRVDPRKLLEGAQTIISLLFNYFHKDALIIEGKKKVSRYAVGEDYHRVLKSRLVQIEAFIKELFPYAQTQSFVDSAPIMDKVWAARAGLGWIGKNTNLIVKGKGSWFFVSEIITDVSLPYDLPHTDFCGRCQKCIQACPTGALQPYEINATLCISYWTIEWKGMLQEEWKPQMQNWVFGCDICQEVCPWNRFAKPTQEIKFYPLPFFHEFQSQNWKNLSERAFRKLVAHSPLSRIRLKKWLNNLGIG